MRAELEIPLRAAVRLAGLLVCGGLAATPAAATSFGRFQHGGRATAQAGALVARADDPSAVSYNPAALVRGEGLELAAGLDFEAPADRLESGGTETAASHTIQFPPALYLGWRPAAARWALGLGLDAPLWQLVDWETGDFPARFTARRADARFFELHPVAAWAIDERWSVGGGLRYVSGELGYGDAREAVLELPAGPLAFEVDRRADTDADGWGADLALHYVGARAGFGAVWRSTVELDGDGDASYRVRDPGALAPDQLAAARAALPTGAAALELALPERWAAGAWWGLGARWRLELDAELALWSATRAPAARIEPDPLPPGFALARRAGWRDTVSVRAGVEVELAPGWSLGAGLAHEPSPVSADAIEPGAPRGDARVGALGASWRHAWLTLDLGWSYHAFDRQPAERQLAAPEAPASYRARAQVWSISARWRAR